MQAGDRIYAKRRLGEGYPSLGRLALRAVHHRAVTDDDQALARQLSCLKRIRPLDSGRVLVVGCGAKPTLIQALVRRGYDALGVEPVAAFAEAARGFLRAPSRVLDGSAERLPMPDRSVELVYANSVLEHVDSPGSSLREMHRVLRPGGIAFILTTNRYRFSLVGDNSEYNVPFFNWFPDALKESIVFRHLHYDPALGNYSQRPAVHWFSFVDLCRLGREAGFAAFYTPIDLVDTDEPALLRRPLRRFVAASARHRPWLRATLLTFTYLGGIVAMVKRVD